ncbi:hypothetical protein [Saccharopolyspora griseoalba]|uniref:DUF4145 domain-containing protein n=1 Tax=Saccharopolyspora griseoalba TaxID=1431848 RepID=A0ABW2LNV2_9PSEU
MLENVGQGQTIWISPDFLGWQRESYAADPIPPALMERSHEIWNHAKQKLDTSMGAFDRSELVTWLNRAVNQRYKVIFKEYNIKAVASRLGIGKGRPPKILARLGVVQPLMLNTLTDLRNSVEHEDADPPASHRCNELVELVWYFLRTTDSLSLSRVYDSELLSQNPGPEPVGYADLSFCFDPPAIQVDSGSFPVGLVSESRNEEWAPLKVDIPPRVLSDFVKVSGTLLLKDGALRVWRDYFGRAR